MNETGNYKQLFISPWCPRGQNSLPCATCFLLPLAAVGAAIRRSLCVEAALTLHLKQDTLLTRLWKFGPLCGGCG